MARNGSGTYQLPAGNPVVTGTTISSTVQNTTMTDVANALTTSIATDGQSVVTANIPFAGYKLTGIGAATVAGDALRYEQVLGTAVLPVANGGTGAATAPLARASLSVAPRATRIDVASVAGTVDLTVSAPDTDDIRITGALAITAFTVAVGRVIRVTAGGAFSLANNANIITQTGATLVLAAGDTFSLRATAANTVEVLALSRVSRVIAQIVNTTTGAVSTGSTQIPYDDTIPQITEGDQYMSQAFTPINAASTLEIEVVVFGSHSAASSYLAVALFQDAIANALGVGNVFMPTATGPAQISFKYVVSAASTTARTYRVRAGSQAAGTFTFNGSSGTRFYGGVMASSITIKEYLP